MNKSAFFAIASLLLIFDWEADAVPRTLFQRFSPDVEPFLVPVAPAENKLNSVEAQPSEFGKPSEGILSDHHPAELRFKKAKTDMVNSVAESKSVEDMTVLHAKHADIKSMTSDDKAEIEPKVQEKPAEKKNEVSEAENKKEADKPIGEKPVEEKHDEVKSDQKLKINEGKSEENKGHEEKSEENKGHDEKSQVRPGVEGGNVDAKKMKTEEKALIVVPTNDKPGQSKQAHINRLGRRPSSDNEFNFIIQWQEGLLDKGNPLIDPDLSQRKPNIAFDMKRFQSPLWNRFEEIQKTLRESIANDLSSKGKPIAQQIDLNRLVKDFVLPVIAKLESQPHFGPKPEKVTHEVVVPPKSQNTEDNDLKLAEIRFGRLAQLRQRVSILESEMRGLFWILILVTCILIIFFFMLAYLMQSYKRVYRDTRRLVLGAKFTPISTV